MTVWWQRWDWPSEVYRRDSRFRAANGYKIGDEVQTHDGGRARRRGCRRTGSDDDGRRPVGRPGAEDRQRRDEELTDERRRREAEATQHERERRQQIELLTRLVETSGSRTTTSSDGRTESGDGERSGAGRNKVVLMKYVEGDDVEAYLTTFERILTMH